MKIGNSFKNAWGGETFIIGDDTKNVSDKNELHSCETQLHKQESGGIQIIKYLVVLLVGYLLGAGF